MKAKAYTFRQSPNHVFVLRSGHSFALSTAPSSPVSHRSLSHFPPTNMADYSTLLPQLLEQEERLQFTKFNSDDALSLGLKLIENAKAYSKPVVVDITVAGHELFHFSMQGTGPDNNEWVRKKK